MGYPSYRRARLRFLVLLLASTPASPALAQEIPLEHCDALPGVAVKVAGLSRWFLIDTAATSMLNLESFGEGSSRNIRVTSWTGTLATSAKQVMIEGLEVGRTKVMKIALPAIDLSAIGKACGRKIDGILGVDLLDKLGAKIDLEQHTLHVVTADERDGHELVKAMQRDIDRCARAFNLSDEQTFGDCLDPKIVLFGPEAEFSGREHVLGFFRDRYFHQKPPARLEIRESAFHPLGEAIWYEYEFTIDSVSGRLRGRGMAMCRKTDGRWRMASMHHSEVQFEPRREREASRQR